jgi:hypothetical protein
MAAGRLHRQVQPTLALSGPSFEPTNGSNHRWRYPFVVP